jgi:hypothetical protein
VRTGSGSSGKISVSLFVYAKVENSTIHDFNGAYGGDGIFAIGGSTATAPDLTVTIKNNLSSSPSKITYNLVVEQFTDPTVSGNVVNGGLVGIYVDTPKGSITSNSLFGSQSGITYTIGGEAEIAAQNNPQNMTDSDAPLQDCVRSSGEE